MLARLRHTLIRLGTAFGLFLVLSPVGAQPLPNLSLEQLQQMQQQMQQQMGGRGNSGGIPAVDPSSQLPPSITLQPDLQSPFAQQKQPPSRLEQILSARAGVRLQQFGYEQLGTRRPIVVPQMGGVQDEYVLGSGDEIVVSLRGQENSEVRIIVDRNGQVLLPRLNPISAAGRNFGSFRQDVEAAVQRGYVATTAFVSVARMRQIGVLVTGEVTNPGQRLVTGLNSVMDAVLLAGGVKKSGSLRNVRLQRGGREFVIDLYSVLTDRGNGGNMRLAEGDRIRVPLLGPAIAVSGLVRQPGIYEIAPGQREMSVNDLLSLAGGEEVRGQYRLSALRMDAQGRAAFAEVRNRTDRLGDSDILFVQLSADETVSRATLAGGTGLAGQYPITTGTQMSEMLKAPGALGPSPYTLFGIVARRDPRTLLRSLHSFTPLAVLSGQENQQLQSDDIVRVFSVSEIRFLTTALENYQFRQTELQEAIRNPVLLSENPNSARTSTGNVGRPSLSDLEETNEDTLNPERANGDTTSGAAALYRPDNQGAAQPGAAVQQRRDDQQQLLRQQQGQAQFFQNQLPERPPALNFQEQAVPENGFATNREIRNFGDLARQLGVSPSVLVNFLADHQVIVDGAVRGPGIYLVGNRVQMQDLVQATGGTLAWTDESRVEIINTMVDRISGRSVTRRTEMPLGQGLLASYVVRPRDQLRFNQIFTDANIGTVIVQGEVRFTGSYQLVRGERLSDLLARAGGLTMTAYPYGTVFLRKSAARAEEEGFKRSASEIQSQLLVAMTRTGSDRIQPDTFSAMQAFVTEIRGQKALGRIAIQADPSVLAANPALDPLLEPGDVIFVPQRPSTIAVLGQVMQPGSVPYRPGASVDDYIQQAGGFARFADTGDAYIVMPDGTSRKVERSWLRLSAATVLPPGSSIVVPRDVTPLDLRQTIIDVTQILSQLAVSVASVAVISR